MAGAGAPTCGASLGAGLRPTVCICRDGGGAEGERPPPVLEHPQPRSRPVLPSTEPHGGTFSQASRGLGQQSLQGEAGPQQGGDSCVLEHVAGEGSGLQRLGPDPKAQATLQPPGKP